MSAIPNYQSTVDSYDFNSLTFALGMCTFICTIVWYAAVISSVDPSRRFAEDSRNTDLQGAFIEEASVPNEAKAKSGTIKERWSNIKDNNMENIPFALIIFFMGVYFALGTEAMISTEADNYYAVKSLTVFIWVFTISRVVYVPCYLFGLQPFRSIVFAFGLFSVLSSGCMVLYLVSAFYLNKEGKLISK